MSTVLLGVAIVYCAYRVMRAARLLNVTLWLAVTSALVSIMLYMLGAPELAVMELSVGAGLVTVLFVYAFAIVGEMTMDEITTLPRWLPWMLILGVSSLLGWFIYPLTPVTPVAQPSTFAQVLWQQRGLDAIAQIILIFSGVMGLLGLLADQSETAPHTITAQAHTTPLHDAATPLHHAATPLHHAATPLANEPLPVAPIEVQS